MSQPGYRQVSYVIIGKAKTGKLYGYIENSFSMNVDECRVRVWRSSRKSPDYFKSSWRCSVAAHMQSICDDLNKIGGGDYIEWNFYRVGSKNCPVKIDWGRFHKAGGGNASKFEYRNLFFIEK
jgi:hypothetical protein